MDRQRLSAQLAEAGEPIKSRAPGEKIGPRVVNYLKRTLPSLDQPEAQQEYQQRVQAARRH